MKQVEISQLLATLMAHIFIGKIVSIENNKVCSILGKKILTSIQLKKYIIDCLNIPLNCFKILNWIYPPNDNTAFCR